MGLFSNFPYTNFHELNLDWILKELRVISIDISKLGNNVKESRDFVEKEIADMVEKLELLKGDIGAERNYVNSEIAKIIDRLESLGVAQEVSKLLREMVDGGELQNLVNNELLGKLDGWIPSGDDVKDYVEDSKRCLVSYLAHAVGLNSVDYSNGPVGLDTPFVVKYSQTKNYGDLMKPSGTDFVTTDNEIVDGDDYPVAYLDCSSFLSLITKCRFYGPDIDNQKNTSPYYYAFKNGLGGKDKSILPYCVEAGSNDTKPYTFDFKNNIFTARMAYLMDSAGNKLKIFAARENTEEPPEFVDAVSGGMESGDILFFATATNPNYKGIGHCGYYVRTLDELNEIGANYNISVRVVGNETAPQYGYVVHVGGSLSDYDDHVDVLRIQTLYDLMYTNSFVKGFVCKPYSNALISSKAERSAVGIFHSCNKTFVCYRDTSGNDYPSPYGWDIDGDFVIRNASIASVSLDSKADLNNIANGSYFVQQSSDYNTISNLPESLYGTSYLCQIIQIGKRENGTRGVQFCIVNSLTNYKFFIRCANNAGEWCPWKKIALG